MKVVIIGGGIGGLTTALCLLARDMDAVVIEQAPQLTEIGAGIQLPPNAMKVLGWLGLHEEISERAFEPCAIEMRHGRTGRQIWTLPLDESMRQRWGGPYLHIHRADLVDVLATALNRRAPKALKLGETYISGRQGADAVHIETSAQALEAACLIGADGIHSTVRQSIGLHDQPEFTGHVAWRATVPTDHLGRYAPPPTACAWVGDGRHAVTYRLKRGELTNFVGVVEQKTEEAEGWFIQGHKQRLLADFAGWNPTIGAIIDAVDTKNLFRWALYDRPAESKWCEGRIALLGDAIHPMLPFMAQGAAMAIEDAYVLGACLQAQAGVPDALGTYRDKRFKRTSRMQARSTQNSDTFHRANPLGEWIWYRPMSLVASLLPGVLRRRFDDFYAYDVTR